MIRLVIAIYIVLAASVIAQESATTIPDPKFPLSFRAPTYSQWTITRTKRKADSSGEAKTPFVQKLVVEKTMPIYHETASVVDGKSWEKWILLLENGSFQFIKYAGDSNWKRLSLLGFDDEFSEYKTSDFEEFQWATAATYKGVREFEKLPVYAFETNTNSGPLTKKEAEQYNYGPAIEAQKAGKSYGTNLVVTAYVNPKTLLPVQFDNGTETHVYSFGAAPTSRLVPPEEVSAALVKWVGEIKALSR